MKLMRESFMVVLIFAVVTAQSDLALASDAWPSATLNSEFAGRPSHYSRETTSPQRENLFAWAWNRANRSTPVDNRAYLYALSFDLYNSLTTDTSHCPMRAEGWRRECGKYAVYKKIDRELHPKDYGGLVAWTISGPVSEITPGIEKSYLLQYLEDGVDGGRIHLDPYRSPPSLDPRSLDLKNPRLYAELRRFMAEHVTAMLAGVAPWEAAAWNAEHRHEWATSPSTAATDAAATPATAAVPAATAPANTPPAPAPAPTAPTDEDPADTALEPGRLLVWLLAIAGGVIAVLLWRRSRR